MKKIIIFLLTYFLFYLIHAQEVDTTLLFESKVEELFKLPIKMQQNTSVASNVIQDENKQPASVSIITKEQIKISGGRSLSEVLTLFVPGFFAIEDQDDVIMGFRGLAPDNNSKVLFLLNGQNMNTEFFWGPPTAFINSLNMEYIEKIEVIRGPGSVTLGQGALLGVINIVTKENDLSESNNTQITTSIGQNAYHNLSLSTKNNYKDFKTFLFLNTSGYDGQTIRREGWALEKSNEGYSGGKVADIGTRLKRTYNTMFYGKFAYKNFALSLLQNTQKRDLYNFYRDRNVEEQTLRSANLEYKAQISTNIKNYTSVSAIADDFALYSVNGTTMGGTGEIRYGLKSIFNIDELWKNNRLAIGIEARQFEMGQTNAEGNNFIANVIGGFNPQTANQELTMSYKQNIRILSVFAENFYSIAPKIDILLAARLDNHPFWGTNIAPRFGLFYSPNKQIFLRATYQSGFRGAVGLHYSGGYRRDGFLRADNYSLVERANIPNENNIPAILPEKMNSFELSLNWKPKEKFNLNVVGFYNQVENVIDVGVIYKDPNVFVVPNIGTDIAGDWNGYWFFKNTLGTFTQLGGEFLAKYTENNFGLQASYAFTSVNTATNEQKELAKNGNSMYLAEENEKYYYKAFPLSMIKANIYYKPINSILLSLTALQHSAWYSPAGTKAPSNVNFNAFISYTHQNKYEISVSIKNLFNQNILYPMTSNAGGLNVSPGTPAWESRSFWFTGRIKI